MCLANLARWREPFGVRRFAPLSFQHGVLHTACRREAPPQKRRLAAHSKFSFHFTMQKPMALLFVIIGPQPALALGLQVVIGTAIRLVPPGGGYAVGPDDLLHRTIRRTGGQPVLWLHTLAVWQTNRFGIDASHQRTVGSVGARGSASVCFVSVSR